MMNTASNSAVYDNAAHVLTGHPVPRLWCLCTWRSSSSCETWEEAGAELDEHLRSPG